MYALRKGYQTLKHVNWQLKERFFWVKAKENFLAKKRQWAPKLPQHASHLLSTCP